MQRLVSLIILAIKMTNKQQGKLFLCSEQRTYIGRCLKQDKESEPNLYHQNLINLANTLKQQYRFSEAIYIYERIAQTN